VNVGAQVPQATVIDQDLQPVEIASLAAEGVVARLRDRWDAAFDEGRDDMLRRELALRDVLAAPLPLQFHRAARHARSRRTASLRRQPRPLVADEYYR